MNRLRFSESCIGIALALDTLILLATGGSHQDVVRRMNLVSFTAALLILIAVANVTFNKEDPDFELVMPT